MFEARSRITSAIAAAAQSAGWISQAPLKPLRSIALLHNSQLGGRVNQGHTPELRERRCEYGPCSASTTSRGAVPIFFYWGLDGNRICAAEQTVRIRSAAEKSESR